MKILVVGSGGREHALAWKLKQSKEVERVFVCPGNAGMALEDRVDCVSIVASDQNKIVEFCREASVEFVVVGPDQALADGLIDRLSKEGISAFGPTAAAAKIESSKAYSKEIMQKIKIPTADFAVFKDAVAAKKFVQDSKWAGWVVKADGLALGKGVVVCKDKNLALQTISDFLEDKKLGISGATIVVEELLLGKEVSCFHLCDGKESRFLGFACDYKQIFDGGQGPNTGGMGAYSPVEWAAKTLEQEVTQKIVEPLLEEMRARHTPFHGILFTGLMITEQGPKVLEFNARFGDPETQVILPRIKEDLLPWLKAATNGELHIRPEKIEVRDIAAVHVVMASHGYPGTQIRKGDPITISGELLTDFDQRGKNSVKVFFAGVSEDKSSANGLKTGGGRVLGITALANTLEKARDIAYENLEKIQFDGAQMRRDIGE